jgi:hypothetical protein
MGPLQHINIIERTRQPKKTMPIHRSCVATASRIIVGSWLLPQYCPCHAFGQFFQCQCIQSTLPSIPVQPLAAFSPNNLDISCSLGDRSVQRHGSSPCKTYTQTPW